MLLTRGQIRDRRLRNMSIEELRRLNRVLVGKGEHFLTAERRAICEEFARKFRELLFKAGVFDK